MYTIDIKNLLPFIEKELPLLDNPKYNDEYFCNAVAQDACYDGQFFYDTCGNAIITYDDVKAYYQDYKDSFGDMSATFKEWYYNSCENDYIREVTDFDDDFQLSVEKAVEEWMIENDLWEDDI